MHAALPPSSRTTFFLPARAFKFQPTAGDPVKLSSFSRSSVVNRSAPSRWQGRIENAPRGRSVSASTSPMRRAPIGVRLAGFKHERTPDGDRRSDFVGREIEREVERRDERARTDRDTLVHPAITPGPRGDLQIQDFTIDAYRFLGGDAKRIDQTDSLRRDCP